MSVRFNAALALSASLIALSIAISPAAAQPAAQSSAPTEAAVDNLLKGLVDQGVLSKKKAMSLADKFHSDMRVAPAPAAAAPAPVGVPAQSADPNVVRVPYVSPAVRAQIRDEVKADVIATAKRENWATPNTFPSWIGNITITGDLRLREEGRFFSDNNEQGFVNIGAINNGAPYNAGGNNNILPPILNSTKDRNLTNFRARLGITAQIDDDFSANIRLASGSDNAPVSTNQTLGNYFTKDSIWLDQAFLKYAPDLGFANLSLTAGRMPNPFVKTELVWDDDVNLDGIALGLSHTFLAADNGDGLNVRLTGGAFPLSYVADDFPANATSDVKLSMGAAKWLFAGQAGADWTHERYTLGFNAAYYDYENVQGGLSPACSNLAAYCLTDFTRPGFMQKGNSLFKLRQNFDPTDSGDLTDLQYFGVASKFEILDLVARADMRVTDTLHLTLTGDYANNLGYDSSAIQALPIVNNNETCSVNVPAGQDCAGAGGTNKFTSGNQAWLARIAFGHPTIAHRWDWNAFFSYSYIEPDAVLDAFNDSDFHLGGTNAKGWVIGGSLGLFKNTALGAKWYSTDAISGPPFSVDTFQLDLTTKF